MDRKVVQFLKKHDREYLILFNKAVQGLHQLFPRNQIFIYAWEDPEWPEDQNLNIYVKMKDLKKEIKKFDEWYKNFFIPEVYGQNHLLDMNVDIIFT